VKGIVIFKGKHGSTKQYADWISSALQLAQTPSDNISGPNLAEYPFLVLGSAVYVGKLTLKEWLRAHVAELQKKRIFFFLVCGTDPNDKEKVDQLIAKNIPREIIPQCQIFVLPGRLLIEKLSWKEKLLLKMGALLAKDPAQKQMMRQGYDGMRKDSIAPLVASVLAFQSSQKTPDKSAPPRMSPA
jgi:menaquinone-dependent protoporphyrinogen IX oxidase